METLEKTKKKTFTLPAKRVTIKFIKKQRGTIDDPDHVLFGGLGPNAYKGFQIPTDLRVDRYVNGVFTDEELRCIENLKGLPENQLSLLRKGNKDDFWKDYMIKLDRNDVNLELNRPDDYIIYKVALAQKDHVAKSPKETSSNHMWVIIDEALEQERTDMRMGNIKRAIMLLGKYESSAVHLRQILMESKGGTRIPEEKLNDLAFLQREAGRLADEDPQVFINIAEDKDLEFKAALKMAVRFSIITRKGNFYYHLDGEKFALPGDNNDLAGAILFLKAPENSEFYMKVIDQINNSL